MEKVTIPLARMKKCVEKPDVAIIYEIGGKHYVAKKESVAYGASTVTFELAGKDMLCRGSVYEKAAKV